MTTNYEPDSLNLFRFLKGPEVATVPLKISKQRQDGRRSQLEEVMASRAHEQSEAGMGGREESSGRAKENRPAH
jgi:hypothetical protein